MVFLINNNKTVCFFNISQDGISPTLQAKTGEEIGPIWKKPGLSESDVRRIIKLYRCDGNKILILHAYLFNIFIVISICAYKVQILNFELL